MLGKQIQRARKALGWSLRDLAEQIGVSHAAIKKYEDDEVTPSSDMLIKLAKALQVRVEYFLRPQRYSLNSIQYRKHVDMPQSQLEEINAKILNQIERRLELESLFPSSPIKAFTISKLSEKIKNSNDIENLANQVRDNWNLGLNPIADLIDTFEEHGIKVFKIDNRKYPKFDGLSSTIDNIPIIVIGDQWPGDRQRFTLAHELGHLLLSDKLAEIEEEAACNHFAGAFLLPKQSLIAMLGEHRNSIEPRELDLLKKEFGISMASILHRLEEAEIVSNSLYRELRVEFNKCGWLKQEPGEQYPQEETYIFEQMIFRALAEEYIGEAKAAELMNIPVELFRSKRAMECQDVTH